MTDKTRLLLLSHTSTSQGRWWLIDLSCINIWSFSRHPLDIMLSPLYVFCKRRLLFRHILTVMLACSTSHIWNRIIVLEPVLIPAGNPTQGVRAALLQPPLSWFWLKDTWDERQMSDWYSTDVLTPAPLFKYCISGSNLVQSVTMVNGLSTARVRDQFCHFHQVKVSTFSTEMQQLHCEKWNVIFAVRETLNNWVSQAVNMRPCLMSGYYFNATSSPQSKANI